MRKCAIWIPKTSNWTCRLCNSFTNGSNAACDWLLYQLNAKFASQPASGTATNDVGLGVAAEVKQNETNEKIVWNKKGTYGIFEISVNAKKFMEILYLCLRH